MNEILIILQVLIFIVLVIIYFLFKNMLPSYFKEKGKNIATKEDIGEITKIVEDIKTDLQKDIISFKSKLDLVYNVELNLINDEKKVLVEFHKSFSKWYNSFIYLDYPDYNHIMLDRLINQQEEIYRKINNQYSLLEIYCEDRSFLLNVKKLTIKIVEQLQISTYNFYIDMKKNNTLLENAKLNQYDLSNLYNERMNIIENFQNEKISKVKILMNDYRRYIEMLKLILKNIE